MPEEINRIVTDRLSDLLFTPSPDADENLRAEGVPRERVVFVGNVMIDSLCRALPHADAAEARSRYGVGEHAVIVTLHRPSNVDDPVRLARLAAALGQIGRDGPVFFPLHPRTRRMLESSGLSCDGVTLHDPIPYLDMLALVRGARGVITDSGGLQEETSVLGVPCLTVRYNTERPITVSQGTNRLVPEPEDLVAALAAARRPDRVPVIDGWDGAAGERVAEALHSRLEPA
jgi:UDP-N-acetylglucosamine 2-epimerase (non-hydrolysing)